MNEQALRIRFGLFVVAVLVMLAMLIMLFGGFTRYFRTADQYTILFDTAEGVAHPVKRSGVRIGEVRDVQLDNVTGKVTLNILVDHQYTIRKSDRPAISRGLLGGDTAIDFLPPEDPKKADPEPMPVGSTLVGIVQTDASALLQKGGELVPPAQEAMIQMAKVLRRIDKMAPLVEDTLEEYRALARAAQTVMPDLKKASSSIQQITKSAQDTMPKIDKAADEFQKLAKSARQSIPEFERTNDELQQLIKSAQKVVPRAERTLDEVQLMAVNLGRAGERIDVMLRVNEPKINRTMDALEQTVRNVNDVLGDENRKNLRDALKNTRDASTNLPSITKNTDQMIQEARMTLRNLDEVTRKADDVFGNLQKLSKPFGERSGAILKNLDESADRLNKTLADMQSLVQAAARSDGTLSKLVTDPSLYNNLNDTALAVTKMLPRFDRILRDVEVFADKIARHPESLGIGGAVRPSSGLKESPSVQPFKTGPGGH